MRAKILEADSLCGEAKPLQELSQPQHLPEVELLGGVGAHVVVGPLAPLHLLRRLL